MEYLQYGKSGYGLGNYGFVLNLVISGIPSIPDVLLLDVNCKVF